MAHSTACSSQASAGSLQQVKKSINLLSACDTVAHSHYGKLICADAASSGSKASPDTRRQQLLAPAPVLRLFFDSWGCC